MGIASPLQTVERPVRAILGGAGAAVDRIDRILTAVEHLAVSIKAIEHEMRGMRGDVQELGAEVRGLRNDLTAVDRRVADIAGTMHGIDASVDDLEGRLDSMAKSLRRIDAIARSVPRLGRRARTVGAEHDITPS